MIDGRYPLKSLKDYHYLAALSSLIKHKKFVPKDHTEEYFKYLKLLEMFKVFIFAINLYEYLFESIRGRLNEYYPVHLVKKKWSLLCGFVLFVLFVLLLRIDI